jgi:hypothetical protein
VKMFNKVVHVGAHHFSAYSVVAADLVGDSWLVVSPLHQFEDLGSDNIQAEHLAVVDIEENAPVDCLGSPDCVGYSEHGPWSEADWAGAPRLQWTVPSAPSEFQKLPLLFASGQRQAANSCEGGTYNE